MDRRLAPMAALLILAMAMAAGGCGSDRDADTKLAAEVNQVKADRDRLATHIRVLAPQQNLDAGTVNDRRGRLLALSAARKRLDAVRVDLMTGTLDGEEARAA